MKRRKLPQLIVEEGDKEAKLKRLKRQLRSVKKRNKQFKSILDSIPKPKTKSLIEKPIITKIDTSYKNNCMNFDVAIINKFDPLFQLHQKKKKKK